MGERDAMERILREQADPQREPTLVGQWGYLESTDDSRRCRWPECDCYRAGGARFCRRSLALDTREGR